MRRLLVIPLALVLAAAPALADDPNPPPPAVTSGAATGVTQTTATIPGTVDPNGAATTYVVEYGTSTSYGLTTTTRDAGNGTDPVTVSVPLTGLTSATTYHYRVSATNAAGTARTTDRTLQTASPPRAPSVSTGAVRELQPTAVRLTGTVNPRGQATRVRFEYGTSSPNRATAYVAIGSGTANVAANASITLTPGTRYRYRVAATNATGTSRGSTRTFTAPRGGAMLTIGVEAARIPYQGTAVITGRATRGGRGGINLALERVGYPFTGPYIRTGATTRSSSNSGTYRFAVGNLAQSSRFRVVATSSPTATSAARSVRTMVRVGMTAKRISKKSVRFSGRVRPLIRAGGTASLQRRTASGRFVTVKRAQLSSTRVPGQSTYRMTVAARRTATVYRVLVVPQRASGFVRGASIAQRVRAVRRR